MNNLMQVMVKLQSLEFNDNRVSKSKNESLIAELRAQVPQQILGHYDRLVARGKKGLAAVRHQVCEACHMSVPIGTVATIMHGDDIQLCGNCGRYLYLPEEVVAAPQPPVPEPAPEQAKPARKPRKRKVPVHAA